MRYVAIARLTIERLRRCYCGLAHRLLAIALACSAPQTQHQPWLRTLARRASTRGKREAQRQVQRRAIESRGVPLIAPAPIDAILRLPVSPSTLRPARHAVTRCQARATSALFAHGPWHGRSQGFGLGAEPRLGRRTALTFPLLPPPQKNRSPPSDSSPDTPTPGGISSLSKTFPVRGSTRLTSLSSPSQVPCQSSPSTQVTPVTMRLDSMVRRMAPVSGSI